MRGFPYNNSCFEWGKRYRDVERSFFGARFLVSASDEQWRYVPVRRLTLFIEQSIAAATNWAVFEPNGSQLWARVENSVGGFLMSLYSQGALQGSTPSQAFFANCGIETMTQTDIDNGVMNIVVGVAPIVPAEFVVIVIAQLAGPPAENLPILGRFSRPIAFRNRWR